MKSLMAIVLYLKPVHFAPRRGLGARQSALRGGLIDNVNFKYHTQVTLGGGPLSPVLYARAYVYMYLMHRMVLAPSINVVVDCCRRVAVPKDGMHECCPVMSLTVSLLGLYLMHACSQQSVPCASSVLYASCGLSRTIQLRTFGSIARRSTGC